MHRIHYDPEGNTLVFLDEASDAEQVWQGKINAFVCGALQDPEKMTELLGHPAPFAPGVVYGYDHRVVHIDGQQVPLMLPDRQPNRALTGIIWLNLTAADLAAIESLEMEGNYRLRVDIEVLAGHHRLSACTFVQK